jgi:hypothetical protein
MADFDEKLNSLLSNPEAMGQIMQLAQSLGGSFDAPQQDVPAYSPPPPPDSNPFGGTDFSALIRLLPLLQELGGQNANARALLLAMRPYLRAERQEKVEQALQLARLICVGKEFLANREG